MEEEEEEEEEEEGMEEEGEEGKSWTSLSSSRRGIRVCLVPTWSLPTRRSPRPRLRKKVGGWVVWVGEHSYAPSYQARCLFLPSFPPLFLSTLPYHLPTHPCISL